MKSMILFLLLFTAQFTFASDLVKQIAADRAKVTEFKFLAEWGAKKGVRIYLAGGTATGFGVYSKQFHENETLKANGLEPLYYDSRFTFNYYDIYRSTQDADIVIDGDESLAHELEEALKKNFDYLQGSKSVWEVRLLKQARGEKGTPGYKEALLSENFLNQHSDSYSTGLVEVTEPVNGESVVRDLFDWNNQTDPIFLKDIENGEIHYYYNPKHFQTARFKQGINPEILSVIRVVTKAAQYGAKIKDEDFSKLKQIVDNFNPHDKAYANDYVRNQILKNGLKIYWHSQNVEETEKLISKLGLKQKLLKYDEVGSTSASSLYTWLSKKPLPLLPLGTGGKTAKELGITVVSHETNSFLAFENITMSRRGHPNVFISRDNAIGEAAIFGDGFYTQTGRSGARGTGLTIRFNVDPNAVEGKDFFRTPAPTAHDFYVIFQNKAALKVIDESLKIDNIVDYFRFLSAQGLNSNDLGLLKKMELKVFTNKKKLTPKEIDEIFQIVFEEITAPLKPLHHGPATTCLIKWLEFEEAATHQPTSDYIRGVLSSEKPNEWLVKPVIRGIQKREWVKNHPEFAEVIFKYRFNEHLVDEIMLSGPWIDHPFVRAQIEEMIQKKTWVNSVLVAKQVLKNPLSKEHPEWMESFVYGSDKHDKELAEALELQHWRENPKWANWVTHLIQRNEIKTQNEKDYSKIVNNHNFIEKLLTQPEAKAHPEWIEYYISRNQTSEFTSTLLKGPLSRAQWIENPKWAEWVSPMMKPVKGLYFDGTWLDYIFTNVKSAEHPEWMIEAIRNGKDEVRFGKKQYTTVLEMPHWKNNPKLRAMCLGEPTFKKLKFATSIQNCGSYFKKWISKKKN